MPKVKPYPKLRRGMWKVSPEFSDQHFVVEYKSQGSKSSFIIVLVDSRQVIAKADSEEQIASDWEEVHTILKTQARLGGSTRFSKRHLLSVFNSLWEQQHTSKEEGDALAQSLYKAIISGDHSNVKRYVSDGGSSLLKSTWKGNPPLHTAVEKGSVPMTRLLLHLGADPNLKDHQGWTALHIACYHGLYEVCSLLLAHADTGVLALSRDNTLAIHYLFAREHASFEPPPLFTKVLEDMIARGAPVDGRTRAGETPLMRAAFRGHVPGCVELLHHGASVHAVDVEGSTPLHHAVRGGHPNVAAVLLEHGADPRARANGLTVEEECTRLGRDAWIPLLKAVPTAGTTPYHKSAAVRTESLPDLPSLRTGPLVTPDAVARLHVFQVHRLSSSAVCAQCGKAMWPSLPFSRAASRCTFCHVVVHSRCRRAACLERSCSVSSPHVEALQDGWLPPPLPSVGEQSFMVRVKEGTRLTPAELRIGRSGVCVYLSQSHDPEESYTLSQLRRWSRRGKVVTLDFHTHRNGYLVAVTDQSEALFRRLERLTHYPVVSREDEGGGGDVAPSRGPPVPHRWDLADAKRSNAWKLSRAELEAAYEHFTALDESESGRVGLWAFGAGFGRLLRNSRVLHVVLGGLPRIHPASIDLREYAAAMGLLTKGGLSARLKLSYGMIAQVSAEHPSTAVGDGVARGAGVTEHGIRVVLCAAHEALNDLGVRIDPVDELVDKVMVMLGATSDTISYAQYAEGVCRHLYFFQSLGMLNDNYDVLSGVSGALWRRGNSALRRIDDGGHEDEEDVDDAPRGDSTNGSQPVSFGHPDWELVQALLLGVRKTVGEATALPKVALKPADYDVVVEHRLGGEPSARFLSHAPAVFRALREVHNADSTAYMFSLGPERVLGNVLFLGNMCAVRQVASTGRSGSFFFKTMDGRYFIKTLPYDEHTFFARNLRAYHEYMVGNPDTLLTRIYGLHSMAMGAAARGRDEDRFIVMANLFNPRYPVHEQYDLKGSKVDRTVAMGEQFDPSKVALKDGNFDSFNRKIRIGPERKALLLEQLEKDTKWLERLGVCDYSLLVGIHFVRKGEGTATQRPLHAAMEECSMFRAHRGGLLSIDQEEVYYIGIIDILTVYNFRKRSERWAKSLKYHADEISAMPPKPYRTRFQRYVASIVE